MATLKTKFAGAKALHLRPAEVATRFEVDAEKTWTDLQNSQLRLIEAEQEAKLARKNLCKV